MLTCGWATSINGNIQYGHFDCGRRDNPLDLRYATWAANLGIPLSATGVHWVQAIAVILLWLAGQYSTSSLPGKR